MGSAEGASNDNGDGPSLADLLSSVFDMSESELEVCLCVMEAGEVTVSDLAADIDYDRSIVARHLNHLADLGVVRKNRRLLDGGGHVFVYTPVDPATVRASLQEHFMSWARDASERLSELNREKVENIADTAGDEPQWRIFHEE